MEKVLAAALRTATGAADACPAAGDLAAFVEGGLSAGEREAIERHAAACDRCQGAFALVGSTLPLTPARSPAWRRWLSDVRLRWLLPAMAAAAVVVYFAVVPAIAPQRASDLTRMAARQTASADRLAFAEKLATNEPAPPPPTAASPASPAPTVQRRAAEPVESRRAESRKQLARALDAVAPAPVAGQVAPSKPDAARNQAPPVITGIVADAAAPPQQAARQAQAQIPQAAAAPTIDQLVEMRKAAGPPPAPPPASAGAQALAETARPTTPISTVLTPAVVVAPGGSVRWRLETGGRVSRSRDGGVTWELQPYRAPSELLAGSAPSATTCWLAGRAGTVLLTLDADRWEPRPFPERIDLAAIDARDALHAIVTTRDGRRFVTDDGGATWTLQR
jgi:hypothetical protein